MSGLWHGMTATEFYAARDKRTSLVIDDDKRLNFRVSAGIDLDEAQTIAGQQAFLTLINLLSRWCRNVGIVVPDVQVLPELTAIFGSGSLASRSIALAESNDPFGQFEQVSANQKDSVWIGKEKAPGAYNILARGWMVFGGEACIECRQDNEGNALSAAMAACLGCSYLFRQALCHTTNHASVSLSLWNLVNGKDIVDGPTLDKFNTGRIAIAGLGAIGSSIGYLLGLLRPEIPLLHLVDRDRVEFHNTNRSPVFSAEDARFGVKKIRSVEAFLGKSGLNPIVIDDWFKYPSVDLGNYDVVLMGANEHGFGLDLMTNVPPVMIGASTGNWEVFLQRHLPLVEDCPECRMPSQVEQVPLICSDGVLSASPKASATLETGALPFLSLAGAVLAVAELCKLASSESFPLNPNEAVLNYLGDELCIISRQRSVRPDCTNCWDRDLFAALRSKTRFFGASLANISVK